MESVRFSYKSHIKVREFALVILCGLAGITLGANGGDIDHIFKGQARTWGHDFSFPVIVFSIVGFAHLCRYAWTGVLKRSLPAYSADENNQAALYETAPIFNSSALPAEELVREGTGLAMILVNPNPIGAARHIKEMATSMGGKESSLLSNSPTVQACNPDIEFAVRAGDMHAVLLPGNQAATGAVMPLLFEQSQAVHEPELFSVK